MDFKDQLKNLFPDHQVQEEPVKDKASTIWLQDDPLLCKYEKR
ncbi:MAG: translation initiation factor, partial [Flavobacterium sp.]|nr:translation initiation factor [Flavobacterium sp.]